MEMQSGSGRTIGIARCALLTLLAGASIRLATAGPGQAVEGDPSGNSAAQVTLGDVAGGGTGQLRSPEETSSAIDPDDKQLKRKLKYVPVSDFLKLAQDAVARLGGIQADLDVTQLGKTSDGHDAVLVGETLIMADPRTNRLMVGGPAAHLTIIDELANEIDVRPRSVYISAIIAEVTLGDDLRFGMDILSKLEGEIDIEGKAVVLGANTSGATILDFPASADAGQDQALQVFSDALVKQSEGQLEVISRPFVFTTNNEQAIISMSMSGGGSNQIEVTPLINSNDEVTLQIANTVESELPDETKSIQELATTVRLEDSDVVILGGIITGAGDKRKELLIFVQPQIIPGSSGTRDFRTWASQNLPDGSGDFNSDADRDGVPNGIEYVFGDTEIRSPAPGQLTAPPAPVPGDITLVLEASSDLQNWSEILRFESGKLAYLAEGVRIGKRVVVDEREHRPAANAIYYRYSASH